MTIENTATGVIPVVDAPYAPNLSVVAQIRQRRNLATGGGWSWTYNQGRLHLLVAEHGTYGERILELAPEAELLIQDATFIAKAGEDIDTLLDLLDKALAEVALMKMSLQRLEESHAALAAAYQQAVTKKISLQNEVEALTPVGWAS